MPTVIFDISMSLDGYVTAAGVRPEEPMGDGGQRLHEWAFGGDGYRGYSARDLEGNLWSFGTGPVP